MVMTGSSGKVGRLNDIVLFDARALLGGEFILIL